MADTYRKNASGKTGDSYLQEAPSDKEVKTVLDSIRENKRQIAPGADTSELDAASDEAKKLYTERANRAEWMSVAERIGNAAVKIGTANAAMKGDVDVSGFKDIAPTDWEGRIGRYAKDYETDLGSNEKKKQSLRDKVKDTQSGLDKTYEDSSHSLDKDYDFAKYKYGQDNDTFQDGNKAAAAFDRADTLDRNSQGRKASADSDRDARDTKKMTVSDLQTQLKQAEEQKKAAVTAASALASQEDLSPKSVTKLEQTMPGVLGRAGITPEQIAAINKEATTKGWFTDSVDNDKRNTAIQSQILDTADKKISTLRQALDQVLQGGARGGAAQAAPAATTTTPPKGRITAQQLQEYATKHYPGKVDGVEKSRAFLTQSGYTVE